MKTAKRVNKLWDTIPGSAQRFFLRVATRVTACLLLFAVLFPIASLEAVKAWVQISAFNHCFLVLPLCLFLVWQRLGKIADLSFRPELKAALPMFIASFFWLFGYLSDVLEAQQLSIITMVQIALYGSFGRQLYGRLAGPLLYLYFLIPTGLYLIPTLQTFTANFAVAALRLVHIPVFSTGAVIEVPTGSFAVAEACAGLRFLMASLAFGVFFAIFAYRTIFRRVLFISLSVVVPVVANGVRVFGLIAASQWIGNAAVVMVDHVLYGWIFFSIVLLILIVIGFSLQSPSDIEPVEVLTDRSPNKAISAPGAMVALILCVFAASVGPLLAAIPPATADKPIPIASPSIAAPWHTIPTSRRWYPIAIAPERVYSDAVVMNGFKVDRFIALYGTHNGSRNVARSQNQDADRRFWSFNSMHSEILRLGGVSVPVRSSTWVDGSAHREVLSFFIVNGHPASSVWVAKWYELLGRFYASHCLSAYIAFSAEDTDPTSGDIQIRKALKDTRLFDGYICRKR